jgi:transcriptional regulator with XRE-family HTH domain
MARVALGLGVRELAEIAQVAPATVSRLEAGEELKPRTVAAIRAALEAAGVEFIPENGGGAGVRLRKSKPESAADATIPVEDLNAANDE